MDGALHDRLPGEDAVLCVHVLEPLDLAGDADSEAAADTCAGVVLVHVLKGRGWRSFSEVDGFILAVGIADHSETSTADARVIHANNANTERRADQGIDGISLNEKIKKVSMLMVMMLRMRHLRNHRM